MAGKPQAAGKAPVLLSGGNPQIAKGDGDAPRKKDSFTYRAKQWTPRNQPWPSTP